MISLSMRNRIVLSNLEAVLCVYLMASYLSGLFKETLANKAAKSSHVTG